MVRLSMSSHIDKVITKVSLKLYTMTLMCINAHSNSSFDLQVMILPHFDYVDFVLDSANKQCTDRIEGLHKRAVRKIENAAEKENREQYNLLLHEYRLTTLYHRRMEHLLTCMYKKREIIERICNRTKTENRTQK